MGLPSNLPPEERNIFCKKVVYLARRRHDNNVLPFLFSFDCTAVSSFLCFFGQSLKFNVRNHKNISLFVCLRTLLACWREIVLCQSVLRNYQREFSFESQKISYSCVTMLQPSNKMSHVNLYLVYVENKL